MANLSDDEKFEIDVILEQRKRKGVLEYLVRWKDSEGGQRDETWEPARNLVVDYAQAVQTFVKSLKIKKTKRSTSRSRKSRSRSRSSSRNRKAASIKSQSRDVQQQVVAQKEKSEISEEKSTRSSRSKGRALEAASKVSLPQVTAESTHTSSFPQSHSQTERDSQSQAMSSANAKTRQQLEVQRVHNEQRPVRDDDLKPRSAIWKVADYAVIVLFILSLIAALILFLEKFMDLEDFKKQAFPNMSVLQRRLEVAGQNLVDLASSGLDVISHAWLYVIEQIKGSPEVRVTAR